MDQSIQDLAAGAFILPYTALTRKAHNVDDVEAFLAHFGRAAILEHNDRKSGHTETTRSLIFPSSFIEGDTAEFKKLAPSKTGLASEKSDTPIISQSIVILPKQYLQNSNLLETIELMRQEKIKSGQQKLSFLDPRDWNYARIGKETGEVPDLQFDHPNFDWQSVFQVGKIEDFSERQKTIDEMQATAKNALCSRAQSLEQSIHVYITDLHKQDGQRALEL